MSAERAGEGKPPGLHALIIGVGAYPHLRGGEFYVEGDSRSDNFAQLSSPPHSAYALAHWLSTVQSTEAAAPLASLELLVSAPPGFEHGYESLTVKAKQATFEEIRDAFERWRKHCDEDEANIALFYFCGHGYAFGQQAPVLMPEDFGSRPGTFFENGIDLDTTMQAVAEFRAATQIFLIDACREKLDTSADFQRGRGLAQARNPSFDPAPDRAIVYSAQYDRRAFGRPGVPTTFTESLVQALGGLGAAPGDRWCIDLESLPAALAKLVRWNTPPAGPDDGRDDTWEQKPSYQVSGPGRPLRLLKAPPEVPFRIAVQPTDAMASAALRLEPHNPAFPVLSRPQPSYQMWEDRAAAGTYQLSATFSGHEYPDQQNHSLVMPPCVERTIDVTPSQNTTQDITEDRSAS